MDTRFGAVDAAVKRSTSDKSLKGTHFALLLRSPSRLCALYIHCHRCRRRRRLTPCHRCVIECSFSLIDDAFTIQENPMPSAESVRVTSANGRAPCPPSEKPMASLIRVREAGRRPCSSQRSATAYSRPRPPIPRCPTSRRACCVPRSHVPRLRSRSRSRHHPRRARPARPTYPVVRAPVASATCAPSSSSTARTHHHRTRPPCARASSRPKGPTSPATRPITKRHHQPRRRYSAPATQRMAAHQPPPRLRLRPQRHRRFPRVSSIHHLPPPLVRHARSCFPRACSCCSRAPRRL